MARRRKQTKTDFILLPDHKITRPELICIAVLAVFILLSLTLLSGLLSSPQFHAKTIGILNDQKEDALTLSVSITGASTALSLLPNDTASAIANELADLSLPLFLIVSINYLEIFLVTTFGWLSAKFLFPVAGFLMIGFILYRKEFLLIWIKKTLILSLALLMLIPVSATITHQIEETFSEIVNQKMHAASHIAGIVESEEEEDANAILSFFSGLADNVVSTVDAAKNLLSTLVDAVAILLITSCIVPVLTLLVFLQALKAALNIEIPAKYLAMLVPSPKRNRQELIDPEEPDE